MFSLSSHHPHVNRHGQPCTNLPNLAFLDGPGVPPELRACYETGHPPPEAAFSRIVNWCHANSDAKDLMHVVRDMQKQLAFSGALHVRASNDPERLGKSSVSAMLDALCSHGIRCAELHVQLCNTNDATQLCAYLDRLGQDGPRVLSIDLSSCAQVVPKELGQCILSLRTLRHFSLRGPVSEDYTSYVTLEDGFFSQARSNHSIEWLEIVGSIDHDELPGDLARQWLGNKALGCIVLDDTCNFARTFCREIADLSGGHAVRDLQLVRWFNGAGELVPQFIRAQTGVLHLTVPRYPYYTDHAYDPLDDIADAVRLNFALLSLTMPQAGGTLQALDEVSPTIASSLERNRRIHMAVNAGVDPRVVWETETRRTLRDFIGQDRDYGVPEAFVGKKLTLSSLAAFVTSACGSGSDEWVLKIVLAEIRERLGIAFDCALNPNLAGSKDLLPPGRRALPPADQTPPLSADDQTPPSSDLRRNDPWSALEPHCAAILALPEVPEPVQNCLSRRIAPRQQDFPNVAWWCLTAMPQGLNLLDLLASMQVAFPNFAGVLNLTVKNCPAEVRNDPASALTRLRNAGVRITGCFVEVNTPEVMRTFVEFLKSPGMLPARVGIGIGQVSVPSALGRALFSNPRLSAVGLYFSWVNGPRQPRHVWYPDANFFDELENNTTLTELTVDGMLGKPDWTCNFKQWIGRGIVEKIFLPSSELGHKIADALVKSAGGSRVKMFRVGRVDDRYMDGHDFVALLDQRLGLMHLEVSTDTLGWILVNASKLLPMVNESLANNHSLVHFGTIDKDGKSKNVDDDKQLSFLRDVLKRNQNLQLESIKAGIDAALKDIAHARSVKHSDLPAFSHAMTSYALELIVQRKLNAGSLTQLTQGSASRTRGAFMNELSQDRTGSDFFGKYFETLFEPDRTVSDLLSQLREAGARLTNPSEYQALRHQVLGAMMDWLEKTLRSQRPGDAQGQDKEAVPPVTDPTTEAMVN